MKKLIIFSIVLSSAFNPLTANELKNSSEITSTNKKPYEDAVIISGIGWKELHSTQLSSVAPKNDFGGIKYPFRFYSQYVTGAWSGAAFDSKRNQLLIFGGGHGDYYGNEVYALNLNNNNIKRITDPAVPIAKGQQPCPQELPPNDGSQPNSRHTYDGLVYMPTVDKMFVFGGSLACGTGTAGNDIWWFDPEKRTWERKWPTGQHPKDYLSAMTAWDSINKFVYLHDRWGGLFIYEPTIGKYGRFSKVSSVGLWKGWGWNMEFIPENQVLIAFSGAGQRSGERDGKLYWWDVGNKHYNPQELITKGGDALFQNYDAPGLAFDPVLKKLIAWNGGNKVYALDWTTKTWIEINAPGIPNKPLKNGTYGRFAYSPENDAFVVYNRTNENAFLLKIR